MLKDTPLKKSNFTIILCLVYVMMLCPLWLKQAGAITSGKKCTFKFNIYIYELKQKQCIY